MFDVGSMYRGSDNENVKLQKQESTATTIEAEGKSLRIFKGGRVATW